jgi:hypothetical protein
MSSHVLALVLLVVVVTLVSTVMSSSVLVVSSSVVVSTSSTMTTSHLSFLMMEMSVHSFIGLHDFKKLLKDLGHMWMSDEIIQMESSCLGCHVLLEAWLIHGFFLLKVSEFLDFVMVDHHSLSFKVLVMEGLLGSSGGIWCLEANESKNVWGTSLLNLDSSLFGFTELFEDFLQLFLSPFIWEVLDIEVASLLWCLISKSISDLFSFSVTFLHGSSDVELQVIIHLSSVKSFDSFLSTLWSVFFVHWLSFEFWLSIACWSGGTGNFGWVIVTDETELVVLDVWVVVKDKRFNFSIWWEQSSDLSISHWLRDVLNIDIVDKWENASCLLNLELNSNGIAIVGWTSDGSSGRSFLLEADETVSSWGMVSIVWDLKTLDLSVLLEFLMEIWMIPWGVDGSNENVVVLELLFVTSKKLFVELECSAPFSVDLEVSHCFSSFVEFLCIFHLNNSRVEWSGKVSSDLWLSISECGVGFFFKDLGNLGRSNVVFWQVVQVNVVLVSECLWHGVFVFVFLF